MLSMFQRPEAVAKSRLGTLLVDRNLISELQLQEALRIQARDNKRLGEVLIEQGLISDRQLNKALKRQTRYRHVAALIAMFMGPLQPFMAQASTVQDNVSISSTYDLEGRTNMKSLNDGDLGDIAAQGINERTQEIIQGLTDSENDELGGLDDFARMVFPVMDFLDAEIDVKGVEYSGNRARTIVSQDGTLDLQLPTRIAELSFKNVRVKGTNGASFGDVTISNVQFSADSSMKVRLH